MPVLILVRHCEPAPGAEDDDSRPLTLTGRRQASRMAQWLGVADVPRPELVLASPAARTATTAALLAEDVVIDDRLRTRLAGSLLSVVRTTPDSVSSLLVVAHNPAVEDLVDRLSSGPPMGMPVAAAAVVEVPGRWSATGTTKVPLRSWTCFAR